MIAELQTALSALIGAPSRVMRTAADPVSAAQVRRWVEAFGGELPVPLDERAAAPRAMLATFSARGLRETLRAADGGSMLTDALSGLGLLPAGVGISQRYLADVRLGDRIREVTEVEAVSPPRRRGSASATS